jgi:hypothetical protein
MMKRKQLLDKGIALGGEPGAFFTTIGPFIVGVGNA